MTKLATLRSVAASLACITLLALVVSGCRGCSIRPIPINIPFGNGLQIGEGINGLPSTSFEDFTLPLGVPGECLVTDLSDLVDQVEQRLPSSVGRLIGVDKLLLEELRFEASSGDFNFLDEITLRITTEGTGGDTVLILNAKPASSFGRILVMEPVGTFDLWALLDDGVDCVTAEVVISGETPQTPVTFSGSLQMMLYPVFRP